MEAASTPAVLLHDEHERRVVVLKPDGASLQEAPDSAADPSRAGSRGLTRGQAMLLRTAIGLGVGVLLVFVFLRLVNVSAVLHQLLHLRPGFALLSGATFLVAYVVRAVRWRFLLRPIEVPVLA